MTRSSMTAVLIAAAFFVATTAAHADPWSNSSDAPVLVNNADRKISFPESPDTSIAATPFIWMLKFYQNFISPLDGDRCPMYPTCSRYSVLAIRKHGPVIGIMMTADRLIHESDERKYARMARIGDHFRYLDPVENNDFWWYHK